MVFLLASSGLYAQMVNLMNMSAEWERTGNRNAAIDAADIVFYNPAGLTKLTEGIHLNISNQTLIRLPEHTADYTALGTGSGRETYSHEGVDWFLPNLYLAYRQDNWALFTGIFVPAGGATVNYPDGSITTEFLKYQTNLSAGPFDSFSNESLEASSVYLSGILGGTYAINDIFSFSIGARYIYAINTTNGEFTATVSGFDTVFKVDTEDTADGISGVIGVNITPIPELNIGIRYETITKMEFETDVNRDDLGMFTPGEKNSNDIPAVFAMGVLYAFTPEFSLEADFTYFFQEQADWGKDDTTGADYAKSAGDAFTVGLAAVFKLKPAITLSGGITYSKFLWEDMDAYYAKLGSFETIFSDNYAIIIGGAFEITEGVKINMGYNFTWWDDETITYNGLEVKTRYTAHVIAIGADCSF